MKKNPLEWAVFALSLVVVLGALGALAYGALTGGDTPPDVAVELGQPQQGTAGFAIPVMLRNRGDTTATAVEVEMTLERSGQEVDAGAFTAAFLPHGSSAEGWVVLQQDPASGKLSAAVKGYERP